MAIYSNTDDINKILSNKGNSSKPITETITNGFFTVDRKWKVTYWNKAAEIILGVPAKDIIGESLWEKLIDILPIEFYKVYDKAFLQDLPVHFQEYWEEMGAWFDVIVYHCDDSLCVSFKSSSHQHAENTPNATQQLKTLTEVYRLVTEVTNDSLWEWDLIANEIFWIDGGHKRTFGYNIENALIPQSFWESCVHPDDRIRILTRLNKIIKNGIETKWEDEYRFKKANGEYALVHDRAHIIYNEERIGCRMIGATQDITARKIMETKMAESEKKLSLITKQTVNAIIITDSDENITWINDAFTKMTGYKSKEVIGRKPEDFLYGKETNPSTIKYLQQQRKDKLPSDCEIVNYTKWGHKYWIHVQGQPLLNKKGKDEQYFAIETNITEKVLLNKNSEQERLKKQKESTGAALSAQEKERTNLGRELHENLNQILAIAKLYVDMARTHEEGRDMYLKQSSGFIANVIGEMRRISKTLESPNSVVGLVDNIKNLFTDLKLLYPINFELNINSVIEQELDETIKLNILRIVQEQINNILAHAEATNVYITLDRNKNEIILLISDDGKGCDIKKEKSGAGILNIKSRVEFFGGEVSIASKKGKGYNLKVILPLHSIHAIWQK